MLALNVLLVVLHLHAVFSECPASWEACIDVKNSCGTTLYIHRTSIDETDAYPTYVTTIEAANSATLDLTAWKDLSGQRLYAWWANPLDSVLSSVQYAGKRPPHLRHTRVAQKCGVSQKYGFVWRDRQS